MGATEFGWLRLESATVFARFAPPAREGSGVAVLVCPPFGWDELVAYRPLCAWVAELSARGHATLWSDLPGSGESDALPLGADHFETWTRATRDGARWLAARSGADRIVALGIGLGGALALHAAAGPDSPVDDLILCGTPARGRTLAREMVAHATVVAARYSGDADPTADRAPSATAAEVNLIGFRLGADPLDALRRFDATELEFTSSGARRALLVGRDGLRPDVKLQAHLEHHGFTVSVGTGKDYEALLAHPQEARTPLRMIDDSLAWLDNGAPGGSRGTGATPQPPLEPTVELLTPDGLVRETVFELALPRGRAVGVITTPANRTAEDLCVVLWPAGALRRVGPNRAWVQAARRWAAAGIPTVRVDLPGIGDGGGDATELVANRDLYHDLRDAEVREVLDTLAELGLPQHFVLGGLCSGAYWSLHAALTDARVIGLLMINLYAFWWSEDLVAEREPGEALTALRGGGWRRLLRRDVPVEKLREALFSLRPGRVRVGRRRSVEADQAPRIAEALDRLRDQSTHALLLFSQDEPLYAQMARQGHLDQLARWPNLRVEEIPTRDHMFRATPLQLHVHARLDAALEWILDLAR